VSHPDNMRLRLRWPDLPKLLRHARRHGWDLLGNRLEYVFVRRRLKTHDSVPAAQRS